MAGWQVVTRSWVSGRWAWDPQVIDPTIPTAEKPTPELDRAHHHVRESGSCVNSRAVKISVVKPVLRSRYEGATLTVSVQRPGSGGVGS